MESNEMESNEMESNEMESNEMESNEMESNQSMDWTESPIRRSVNGWDLLIILRGTLLYRGVDVSPHPLLNQAPSVGLFLSTLSVASWYAFSSDTRRGEYGKIITYQVEEPIVLLDMESIRNLKQLTREYPSPIINIGREMTLLEYSFGYSLEYPQIRRRSHSQIDIDFVKWFCPLPFEPELDGFGYTHISGFHSEVFICPRSTRKISLIPIEYRFVLYYNPDIIIETENGLWTGNEISFESLNTRARWGASGIHSPTRDRADRFLWQEPFRSLRRNRLDENRRLLD